MHASHPIPKPESYLPEGPPARFANPAVTRQPGPASNLAARGNVLTSAFGVLGFCQTSYTCRRENVIPTPTKTDLVPKVSCVHPLVQIIKQGCYGLCLYIDLGLIIHHHLCMPSPSKSNYIPTAERVSVLQFLDRTFPRYVSHVYPISCPVAHVHNVD